MVVDTFVKEYQKTRKETDSLKWDALKERFNDENLLPLWVADMEFATPKTVTDALAKRISHGVFGYAQNEPGYFESFASWQKKRHNIDLNQEWFRFSTGVVQALYHLILCFSEEGDGVLIQPPVYYPFFNAIRDTNRKTILSPLKEKNLHYEIDLADFEEKLINEQPKIFILCSPHNPVGRIWKEEELKAVLDLCKKYDCLVISDEIHQDFEISGTPFVSTLSIEPINYHQGLIVVNAPSKTFNLASLLNAHIIIPDEKLRNQFDQKIKTFQQTETNLLGQLAGKTAYETGGEWFDDLLVVIKKNYAYLEKRLKEIPEISYAPLEGSYLAWLDLRKIIATEDVKKVVQDEAGLAVDYGEWFSEDCEGFIRLNLGTTPEILEQALDQLVQSIKNKKEGL